MYCDGWASYTLYSMEMFSFICVDVFHGGIVGSDVLVWQPALDGLLHSHAPRVLSIRKQPPRRLQRPSCRTVTAPCYNSPLPPVYRPATFRACIHHRDWLPSGSKENANSLSRWVGSECQRSFLDKQKVYGKFVIYYHIVVIFNIHVNLLFSVFMNFLFSTFHFARQCGFPCWLVIHQISIHSFLLS